MNPTSVSAVQLIFAAAILLAASLGPAASSSSSSSTSSAPTPAPSPMSTSSTVQLQQWWIVEGNSTGKRAPNCSDLCVTVLSNAQGFPVSLQPCQGHSSSELWIYDPASTTIVTAVGYSSAVRLCLDASSPASLHLSPCVGSAGQVWQYEDQTMRIATGSNTTTGMSYLQGQERLPSGWGSGINAYTLSVASSESEQSTFTFTLLPFFDPLLVLPEPNSSSGNLVINGGFERSGMDPAKGFVVLDTTEPIPLCSWFTSSNEVEYSGTNLWPPEEGTHSLHLNSAKAGQPGAVTQVLPTKIGSNYTLVFFMAGNPDLGCGTRNKTMEVRVDPSSLPPQFVWFEISDAGMGWTEVSPMGFTALADFVNLTFASLTLGSCGPVIDNISVAETDGPLPRLIPFGHIASSSSGSTTLPGYAIALISLAAVASAAAAASFVLRRILRKHPFFLGMRRNISNRSFFDVPGSKFWDSLTLSRLELASAGEDSGVRELTFRQIEKATKNFTTIIGEGGFSTVYRAQFSDGTVGAVKMEKTRDRSRQIFKQELSVLVRVRHAHLVNLIGFCNERAEGILVFEFMAHGNLHYRLHPPAHQMYQTLPWKKRMGIAFQIASALEYLHEVARPPVVHTDVKAANILLDEQDNAKLCDFGFSSKAGPDSSVFHTTVASVKGSLGYLDPHYMKNGRLSSKSDVYSFGVLLMELVTGMLAFDMHRSEALASFALPYVKDAEMMELIVDARLKGEFDGEELKAVCAVARLCINEEPAQRPAMAEVVQKLRLAFGIAQADDPEELNRTDRLKHEITTAESLQTVVTVVPIDRDLDIAADDDQEAESIAGLMPDHSSDNIRSLLGSSIGSSTDFSPR